MKAVRSLLSLADGNSQLGPIHRRSDLALIILARALNGELATSDIPTLGELAPRVSTFSFRHLGGRWAGDEGMGGCSTTQLTFGSGPVGRERN